jgi:esterase/lipase
MITSRKRLGRIIKEASREVVMITWPLLVRQGRENERVPERSVTVMKEHHIWGRRRT